MTNPLRRIDARNLTEALLRPADHVAEFSREDLRGLSARLGHGPLPSGELLRIDSWTLRSGLNTVQTPFAWTPQFAKRTLGLAALRLLVFGVAPTPREAVAHEVDRLVRMGQEQPQTSTSLARYLASCSSAIRGAAIALATTYATEAFCAIDWKAFVRHPLIGSPDASALLRGQGLLLRGRAELVADLDGPTEGDLGESRLVIMHGAIADDTTLLLGLSALAATLSSSDRRAPARMVAYFPTSAQAAVLEITENVLQRTALGIAKRVANCRLSDLEAHAA